MTINISKKQLIIASGIVLLLIIGLFGWRSVRVSRYEKLAKECQLDLYQLNTMSSLLSEKIHDIWYDYIMKDRIYIDRKTGNFYKSYFQAPEGVLLHYCSSFSEAISEVSSYYEQQGSKGFADSLYTKVKSLLKKMKSPPSKFSAAHSTMTGLFHAAEGMYKCAISPDGSLKTYTESINRFAEEYSRYESQLEIELGEINKDYKLETSLNCLLRFTQELSEQSQNKKQTGPKPFPSSF